MEWINVEEELPKTISGKFTVKLTNGNTLKAFFYLDAMAWIAFYGQKTCHWWDSNYPHGPLYNVTHWEKS